VSIGSPDLRSLQSIWSDAGVTDSVHHWVLEAQRREEILYFSIFPGLEPVGEALLHDLNGQMEESLIEDRKELMSRGRTIECKRALRQNVTYLRSGFSLIDAIIDQQ
jgi:hypothetical protein